MSAAERWVAWLARRSGLVVLASAGLAVLAGLSLLRLSLDVDLLSMLPQGRPRFADYERYVSRFGAQDVAVVVIRAPERATAVRFAAAYEAALAGVPEVRAVRSRVDLAAFHDALRAGALPRLMPLSAYDGLRERLSPAGLDEAVRRLRLALATPGSVGTGAYLAGDPLGLGALLGDTLAESRPDRALQPGSEYIASADGKRVLLLIRPAANGYDVVGAERLAAALAAAESRARAASGVGDEVGVGYTGGFAYGLEDATLLRSDMILYSALALAGVLGVFLAGYRSLAFLPLVAWQVVLATLLTFALGLLVEGRLNAISLAFAVIFYGLGIDAAIHFYTRFLEEWRSGGPIEPALARAVAGLLPATTVAATTSAAAFAVIGFSDLAGVSQLGFLTALGMLLNVPLTFVVLPAQILWAHRHAGLAPRTDAIAPTGRLARVAVALARHRAAGAVAAVVLIAVAWLPARAARLDTDLFNLRPRASAAARVQDEIERHFGIVDPSGTVLVETPDADDAAATEAALETVERVTAALRELVTEGLVDSLLSPASLLPSRATQEARLAAWAALPRAQAADGLAERLAAAGFRIEPFAPALDALRAVPAPQDPTRAPLPGLELLFDRHLRRDAAGLAILIPFAPRDADALAEAAERLPAAVPAAPDVELTVTGRPLMERELHATMRLEMVWFLVAVALGNAAIVWVRVRSVATTLAILAVPAVVVLLLLALLGASGMAIDAVNLIVLPLTVGLGVDNCVYLAERCRETGSLREAVASTGRALAITAGTTTIGFGVLALSRYPALSGLGVLAATSMALCFVVTLLLLPLVLPRRLVGPPEEVA